MLLDGATPGPAPESRVSTIDGVGDPMSWALGELEDDCAAGWALVQRDWCERAACARGGVRAWGRSLAVALTVLRRLGGRVRARAALRASTAGEKRP